MSEKLKVLIVEDKAPDAELMTRALREAGIAVVAKRVQTEADLRRELGEFAPDIVLSDFNLPGFGGLAALALTRKEHPEIPFVFVSGSIGDEQAIETVKLGARDYVLKNNLERLPHAMRGALEGAAQRSARGRAEQALRASHARNRLLAMLVEQSSDGIFSKDLNGVVTSWNQGAARLYGFTAEEAQGTSMRKLQHAHLTDEEYEQVLARIRAGKAHSLDVKRSTKSGALVDVLLTTTPLFDEQGSHIGEMTVARDITERKRQELKIARLSRIHRVLSGINSAIVRIRDRQELFDEACRIAAEDGGFSIVWIGILDPDTRDIRTAAVSGIEPEVMNTLRAPSIHGDKPGGKGLVGRAFREMKLVHDNDVTSQPGVGFLRKAAIEQGLRSVVALPLLVAGAPVGVIALYAEAKEFFDAEEMKLIEELTGDISFALESMEKAAKLDYLAYYDVLTGLPNRSLVLDRLAQGVAAAKQEQRKLPVCVLDLERFRVINKTLGRQAGDALLTMIAERLRHSVAEADAVGRVGADCFAVIAQDVNEEADVPHFIEQTILPGLAAPFLVEGQELRVGVRIGVSFYPNDGSDPERLLKNAEAAAKHAIQSGEQYAFYAPEITARVTEKMTLERKLRAALEHDQFVLHYQPKVELKTGRIVGLEALIRWNDPATGLVPPFKFIPVLEATGMILEVGGWVIRRAAEDHREWQAKGLEPPRIAVNVSQVQMRQKTFVQDFARAIGGPGTGGGGIDVEVTESLLMENVEESIQKLKAIRAAGAEISIDDFGTGYSSLSHIARLPIDILKIDRAFIINMAERPESMSIVSTIIALAHSLDFKVIAEGVETEEQAKLLRLLKCDQMQGYLFSRPVPAAMVVSMLSARLTEAPSA